MVDAADSGTIEASGASARWMLDGSAMFLSEFEGDVAAYGALVNAANVVAVGRFAAVVIARFPVGDRRLDALRAAGFEDDDDLDGFVTLVRQVR